MSLPFLPRPRLLVLVPLSLALPAASGLMTAPVASAAGILPPSNPAASIPSPPALVQACYGGGTAASCQSAALAAINAARAAEGVGPISLPANFSGLSTDEQLFVLVDLERVDRGIAPLVGMAPVLDGEAQAGASGHTDPTGPSGSDWTSTVAVGEASALTTDFDWMYDDGPASLNVSCPPSCWGHRDAILGSGELMGAGSAGSAYATVEASGWSEIPTFTWAQELPALSGAVTTGSISVAAAPGTANVATVPVVASGAPMVFAASASGPALSVSPTCSAPAGGVCDLTVTFAPPTAGSYAGTITVTGLNVSTRVAVSARSGHGYWQVAADGGVFDFGGGGFRGSTGGTAINRPVVGMAATPDHGGYWLVAADGGVFSFGDAAYHGSTGAMRLNSPIVGMAATPDDGGYRLVAADGGVFAFGSATFDGSPAGVRLDAPVVSIVDDAATGGYWLTAADGGVFNYDAPALGSLGGVALRRPMVGASAS